MDRGTAKNEYLYELALSSGFSSLNETTVDRLYRCWNCNSADNAPADSRQQSYCLTVAISVANRHSQFKTDHCDYRNTEERHTFWYDYRSNSPEPIVFDFEFSMLLMLPLIYFVKTFKLAHVIYRLYSIKTWTTFFWSFQSYVKLELTLAMLIQCCHLPIQLEAFHWDDKGRNFFTSHNVNELISIYLQQTKFQQAFIMR